MKGEPNIPHLRAWRMRWPFFCLSLHPRSHVFRPIFSDALERLLVAHSSTHRHHQNSGNGFPRLELSPWVLNYPFRPFLAFPHSSRCLRVTRDQHASECECQISSISAMVMPRRYSTGWSLGSTARWEGKSSSYSRRSGMAEEDFLGRHLEEQ